MSRLRSEGWKIGRQEKGLNWVPAGANLPAAVAGRGPAVLTVRCRAVAILCLAAARSARGILKPFYKGLPIEKLWLVRCQRSSLLLRLLLKDWLNQRLEAWLSYLGINPITLEPLFIKKDTDTRTATIVVSNPISGDKSGVKLPDLGGKFAAAVIPFVGTLRQGKMAHHKRIVTGSEPLPIGPDKEKSRNADSISIARQLLRGLPIQLPLHTGYSRTPGPPERLVQKKIHPDHAPQSHGLKLKYAIPVFNWLRKTFPIASGRPTFWRIG